jgi:hypothetical protein
MGRLKQLAQRERKPTPRCFFYEQPKQIAAGCGKISTKNQSSLHKISAKEIIEQLGAKMEPGNYLVAPGDRHDLVCVKTVSILGNKQYGLFAKERIKAGTILGRYTGRKYSKQAFKKHMEQDRNATSHYAMEIDDGIVCSQQEGNFTRFANCSTSQPNTAFIRLPDKSVGLKAIRYIEPEQQVLVDYNGPCDLPDSERQFFLNPEDGPLSTIELQIELNKHYTLKNSPAAYPALGVLKGAPLYTTGLLWTLMNGQSLNSMYSYIPEEVDILCLKAAKQGIVKLAAQQEDDDPFTPLMLACYLGQVDNVRFLIENGASVNRQQNLSGNCPLFFALEGYSNAPDDGKEYYLAIIQDLLGADALTTVHDKESKTFLHKASLVLQPDHLGAVLSQLATMGVAVKELFNYVDINDRDIVVSCLEERCFGSVATLLKFYPSYFGDHFHPPIKGRKKSDLFSKVLNDILESYTPEEAHGFFECLKAAHIAGLDLSPLDSLRDKAAEFEQVAPMTLN